MKNMKRLIDSSLHNERGAALVAVFLVLMVLLTLGLGVMALSMGSAKQAVVTDTYEKAYYAAEGGAQQGVEYLRSQVLRVYSNIKSDLASGITSSNNATSFFNNLNTSITNSATKFNPVLTESSGAASVTGLTASIAASASGITRTYTITSTAAGGEARRIVVGKIDVTFKEVTVSSGALTLSDHVVMTGGTFHVVSGDNRVNNPATVLFGSYDNPNTNPWYDGFVYDDKPNTSNWINPGLAGTLTWEMEYPGYSNEAKYPNAPSIAPIANGASVTNAAFKNPPYNWTVPSPVYLEGAPGASYSVSNFSIIGGQVVSTGNLSISAPNITGTADKYVKIYCSGDLTISSSILKYVKIFCDGNLTISGGSGTRNCKIYVKGNVTLSTVIEDDTIICGKNLTLQGNSANRCTIYAKQKVTMDSNNRTNMKIYCDVLSTSGGGIGGDTIVYAESSLNLCGNVAGLFYTNGTAKIGTPQNGSLTGQVVAKGDTYTYGYQFNKDPNISRLYDDAFVTSTGSATMTITLPLNTEIFQTPATIGEQ